jgi:adenosine deaminase
VRDIRTLPKANLHLHLTGAMRPATLTDLAARYGVPEPVPLDPDAVHGWAAFQGRYDVARNTIRSAADVARVVLEAAADNADDGCGWLEIQVDPTSYAPRLGGLAATVEAVLAAAERVPIPVGVTVAASWGATAQHASRLAELAARYAGRGVVGFGLSNDERLGRVPDFAPACAIAAAAGLLVVPHAGFYEPAAHVRACVTHLRADRIGHGLTAADDPGLLETLATRGVALEVCPTSYPPLGVLPDIAAIPLRSLLHAGVPVALATDDPLLFGAGLAEQYALVRDAFGCTDAELAALARQSVSASAAPPDLKHRLTAAIDAWLHSGP